MAIEDVVLFHILPRLPAKSAVRFKSVSKGWNSFLTTPMFAHMNLAYQNQYKLLFESDRKSCTFRTFSCEAPRFFTSPRQFPFEVKFFFIMTSFDGLVCAHIGNKGYSDLVLWNPLTGDYKTLSKTNAHEECFKVKGIASILYYNSSEDDYKLLHITNSRNVYVYSLKPDVWRKIDQTEDLHRLCKLSYKFSGLKFSCQSSSLNGKLYLLKEDQAHACSFIRLDLKTESLTEVATPFHINDYIKCLGFTILRDCLYVWMITHTYLIEFWRMDGDGDGDWTKVVTYRGTRSFPANVFVKPVHLTADGTWLIHYTLHTKLRLYETNPEKALIKDDKGLCWNTYTSYKCLDWGVYFSPLGKYLETLVSPNQYMK